ncbi:PHD finger-like domain-containing protein 5A [Platanthera guangdongensis]|uniref:PHD finger-like domain-containing protein 5A n=1 Tax=Platanthera guangdongensis TaxID=2320717 RepID=A0ABR2M629_9ASPA
MAKHHPDLIMCRKQPGIAIGRLCEKCDGKCVICDSYVRPCTLVRVYLSPGGDNAHIFGDRPPDRNVKQLTAPSNPHTSPESPYYRWCDDWSSTA